MCDAISTPQLRKVTARVAGDPLPKDDADRIDQLRQIESLKCALEARQARITAEFDASQRQKAADAGVAADRRGRGIAHQVALARRESPTRGSQHVGLAKLLRDEMPHTMEAFRAGRITEWRAMVMARETACLELEHRHLIDSALASDPARLEQLSDRQVIAEVKKLAVRLDPAAVAKRRRRAEADRNVTLRPAPDTMAYLTALMPVKQAVATWAALKATADAAVATGRATNRGQVMVDTLVGRITGRSAEDPAPVSVSVVLTDAALLDQADDLARLLEWGPIPADLAREIVADALDHDTAVTLRRLFARPETGGLVSMESRQRLFPEALARFIRLRDEFCRHPWCNNRIRHIDHVRSHDAGGPTTAENGQGLCEPCNHAKQAPGWRAGPAPGDLHAVEIVAPTGHSYRSTAPPITDPAWSITRLSWADLTAVSSV